MRNGFRTHPLLRVLLLGVILVLLVAGVALAAGNIDSSNKWAWGTNVGWLNFSSAHGGVTVYTDHLAGYVWAENVGWIRLGSTGGGSPYYANTTNTNYGVNYNNATGVLSGYAWGTNVGWINFNPTHGGVTISTTTGDFSGYAWGENVGWINFNGTATDTTVYKVKTTNPTAVTVQSFKAQGGGTPLMVGMALLGLLLMGGVVMVRRKHA